jgi:arginase family enzyme
MSFHSQGIRTSQLLCTSSKEKQWSDHDDGGPTSTAGPHWAIFGADHGTTVSVAKICERGPNVIAEIAPINLPRPAYHHVMGSIIRAPSLVASPVRSRHALLRTQNQRELLLRNICNHSPCVDARPPYVSGHSCFLLPIDLLLSM